MDMKKSLALLKRLSVQSLMPRLLFCCFVSPLVMAWIFWTGVPASGRFEVIDYVQRAIPVYRWIVPFLFLSLFTGSLLVCGPFGATCNIYVGIYLFGLQALIRSCLVWFVTVTDYRALELSGFEIPPQVYTSWIPYIQFVGLFGGLACFGLILACYQGPRLWVHSRRSRIGASLYGAGILLSILCLLPLMGLIRGYHSWSMARMETLRMETIRATHDVTLKWVQENRRDADLLMLRGNYLRDVGRPVEAAELWETAERLKEAEEWNQILRRKMEWQGKRDKAAGERRAWQKAGEQWSKTLYRPEVPICRNPDQLFF